MTEEPSVRVKKKAVSIVLRARWLMFFLSRYETIFLRTQLSSRRRPDLNRKIGCFLYTV